MALLYLLDQTGPQWMPLAHTARAWTDPERRYSQIENESNSLLTGIASNKMYLMGVPIEAVVDHKPLLPLYNNRRRPKQMRIDRHWMKFAAYNFEVIHMAGTKLPCDYTGCPKNLKFTKQEKVELEDKFIGCYTHT